MTDIITVLVAEPQKRATKIHRQTNHGIETIGYDAGTLFGQCAFNVTSLHQLSSFLQSIEPKPRWFVIRGILNPALDPNALHRRLSTKLPNFLTPIAGHRWVMIDFDKIDMPVGMDLKQDTAAAIEHLVHLLPVEFHDCSYHYQLSSSAGIGDPRKISAHVWFWLTKLWADQALKAWAKAINTQAGYKLIDSALFNDVQAHYTAAPIFEGIDNPFPTRSALIEKTNDAVSIRAIATPKNAQSQRAAGEFAAGPGFEGWLQRIGDHSGGDGFHEPIIKAIASYVSVNGREGTNADALFQSVSKRVVETDRSKHDDAYVEHMASREHIMAAIGGALDKYGDRPISQRRSRLTHDLPSPEPVVALDSDTAHRELAEMLNVIFKGEQS